MVELSVAGGRASVSKVPQISALKFFITRNEFEALVVPLEVIWQNVWVWLLWSVYGSLRPPRN
jgi:hypothetical protein